MPSHHAPPRKRARGDADASSGYSQSNQHQRGGRDRYFSQPQARAAGNAERLAMLLYAPAPEGRPEDVLDDSAPSSSSSSRSSSHRDKNSARRALKRRMPTAYLMKRLAHEEAAMARRGVRAAEERARQEQERITAAEEDKAREDAVSAAAAEATAAKARRKGAVGPVPLPAPAVDTEAVGRGDYGGNLLAGEGDAIAQYVQAGVRIPRRGEIGLAGEEVESYEKAGFVMSGSRHRRMNAIRMRKEAQVLDAEEKWTLTQAMMRDRHSKEAKLINDLARATKHV
jgi:NF-kappa-B-activating protein